MGSPSEPEILAERFTLGGKETDLTLGRALRLETRQCLMDTMLRATIAESIVAWALGGRQGNGWSPPDVTLDDGTTIEVKSASEFVWDPTSDLELGPRLAPQKPGPRLADIWVGAYAAGDDPLNLDAWHFFVCPCALLPSQQNLPLSRIDELFEPVSVDQLTAAVSHAKELCANLETGSQR